MNKCKRTNEVTDMDDSSIIDSLNENPLLYRSIQAIAYIKNNLPIITQENCLSETNDYYTKIIKMFFSGCKFYYEEDNYELTNTRLNICIFSNYQNRDFRIGMLSFIEFFETILLKQYVKENISFSELSITNQDNGFILEISLCNYNSQYDQLLNYYYEFNNENDSDENLDYI